MMVQKIKYPIVFCFLLIANALFFPDRLMAQSKMSEPEYKISVEWQPVQNYYAGKNQTLSVLTIINESAIDLPAQGWSLFFNYGGGFLIPENNGLSMSFVNGDLYKIEPIAGFKGIPAGKSHKYELIRSGRIENITQSPQGFYMVLQDKQEHVFAVKASYPDPPAEFLNSLNAAKTWMNPEFIYAKNQSVSDISLSKLPVIFPSPKEYQATGSYFILSSGISIYADPIFLKEANYLSEELSKVLKDSPSIVKVQPASGAIIFKKQSGFTPEAYQLNVSESGIEIIASSTEGAFYAVQSLKTMLAPDSWKAKQQSITISGVSVYDEPRFSYRSFMLDVARNFQPKQEILKVLDIMSLYKLNVFHFHFSDDEGWRVEIPSLPELTQVGSVRGHTNDHKNNIQPSFASGGLTNQLPGSGHLSRKDFIEVLKYATARHIQVIPEIESPGHARAAIKSMEVRYEKLMKVGKLVEANKFRLIDPKDQSQYRSVQGWNDNVMDVSLPSVYNFVEKVTDELLLMYKEAGAPLKTIHYGGDEVPRGVWEKSPGYLALKKSNAAIQNTDDLWYYYFGKLDAMAKKRGLFVSGWEEAGMRKTKLDGKPFNIANPDFADDNFQLHVWNNVIGSGSEDLAYRLANGGYKVVLSPVSNQYFDLAYNSSYFEPGLKWGGLVDIDKPYYFIPFDFLKNVKEDGQGRPIKDLDQSKMIRLTDYGKLNIVGLQGLLWSENNVSTERLEYMMLPKLLSLAERAWAKEPEWAIGGASVLNDLYYENEFSSFATILGKRELPRLTCYNGGYAYRIPEVGLKMQEGKVYANSQLPGLIIRYTSDGSDPVPSSSQYTQPITEKGKLRFAAFDVIGRRGRVMELDNK